MNEKKRTPTQRKKQLVERKRTEKKAHSAYQNSCQRWMRDFWIGCGVEKESSSAHE